VPAFPGAAARRPQRETAASFLDGCRLGAARVVERLDRRRRHQLRRHPPITGWGSRGPLLGHPPGGRGRAPGQPRRQARRTLPPGCTRPFRMEGPRARLHLPGARRREPRARGRPCASGPTVASTTSAGPSTTSPGTPAARPSFGLVEGRHAQLRRPQGGGRAAAARPHRRRHRVRVSTANGVEARRLPGARLEVAGQGVGPQHRRGAGRRCSASSTGVAKFTCKRPDRLGASWEHLYL